MENKGLIESLKNTYCFYRQHYVIMDSEYTKTVEHYFTDKVIESHLEGKYALCVFAGPKVTRFLSVDVDEGGKRAVRQVVDAFVTLGVPRERIYISTSGKKGYHVDIFFSPWIYNDKAKNLYDLMIWQTGLNPKKVEYRPTATQAIKVPLGVHAKTGNRCWFLDQDTLKPIEDMDYINTIIPIPDGDILNLLRIWNKKRWNELYAQMVCEDSGHDESIIKDIKFDQEYFISKNITEPGTRHQVMLEIAIDMRHFGANSFQIQKALRGFYFHQSAEMIESSERDVMEDIGEISRWAEDNIPVWKYRKSPNEGKSKPIVVHKEDVESILRAPTSAARKVALLLYSYCKMFKAAHISCSTIAEITGCSEKTVSTAIDNLVKLHIINRQSGGCHYSNGRLVRKSNTYFIPSNKQTAHVDDKDILAETFETSEKISKENFSSYYYRTLASMCRPEYLAKFLTKPELQECEKWSDVSGAEGTDDGAGRVACVQHI